MIRLIRTIGVSPIASRMLSKTFFFAVTRAHVVRRDYSLRNAPTRPLFGDFRRTPPWPQAHRARHAGGREDVLAFSRGGARSDGSRATLRPGAPHGQRAIEPSMPRPQKRGPPPTCFGKCRPGDASIPATRATTTVTRRARLMSVGIRIPASAPRSTTRWAGWPLPIAGPRNGGGEGGADDKVLARIQFAHATTAGVAAGLVPRAAVESAADMVAADQQPDGSWRLDASDSIGSPATYGTALATVAARRTLVAAGTAAPTKITSPAPNAGCRTPPPEHPDAAAIVLAFAGGYESGNETPHNWTVALDLLKKGQGRDGGWGPYVTSPSEAFDTALATLALKGVAPRASRAGHAFTPDALRAAIAGGRTYLLRQQLADGSWNETTRPAGQSSYAQRISTTGWALLALVETRK